MPQYHPNVELIKEELISNSTVDTHLTILTFFKTSKHNQEIDTDAYTVIESTLNNDQKIKKQLERLNNILKKDKTNNQVLYITSNIYFQIMKDVLHHKVKNELAQCRPSTPPTTTRDGAPKIAGLR